MVKYEDTFYSIMNYDDTFYSMMKYEDDFNPSCSEENTTAKVVLVNKQHTKQWKSKFYWEVQLTAM